jgi:diketogulonate reductase-like aldo/keto reductase
MMITRNIPSTGEQLPVIGLGTWKTFDVTGTDAYPDLKLVLNAMHAAGGTLIDSSPMYGMAEEVIGNITSTMDTTDDFFYATKVWTTGKQEGIKQMESSMQKMGRKTIDLMQIHNLTDWKTHLATLNQWKEEGRIRYTGITHYTDAMHGELEKIISSEKVDFVQFNYSILSRSAESRLLSAAADHGVATLINRPLGTGDLFYKVTGKELPAWAAEYGITNWGAFFLKYLIAHPAVTCVIPATGNPAHAKDNLEAGKGELPDDAIRKKMVEYVSGL